MPSSGENGAGSAPCRPWPARLAEHGRGGRLDEMARQNVGRAHAGAVIQHVITDCNMAGGGWQPLAHLAQAAVATAPWGRWPPSPPSRTGGCERARIYRFLRRGVKGHRILGDTLHGEMCDTLVIARIVGDQSQTVAQRGGGDPGVLR